MYNYKPTGDCLGRQEKINGWGSCSTTLCCRNALTVLSQALAIQVKNQTLGSDNIFLGQDQWVNRSGGFQRQQSVSVNSCRFEDLYYGSSKCSNLSLSNMTDHLSIATEQFGRAIKSCSSFGNPFDLACRACTKGVLTLRDAVLDHLDVKANGTERAICGVGVVISLAAGTINSTFSMDNFFHCLPALDKLGK